MRRQLARLDHGAVAGGDGADRGRERELQRIVPGRDDADNPERLRDQAILARHELQRGVHAARRHPFLQMLDGVLDLDIEEQRLGDGGLDGRAVAEIGRDRLDEPRLIVLHHLAQPPQPVDPHLAGRHRLGARGVDLGMKGIIQGGKGRALQRLVHGISPWFAFFASPRLRGEADARSAAGEGDSPRVRSLPFPPSLPLRAQSGKSGQFPPISPKSPVTKTKKPAPGPFPNHPTVGTYRPHPPALAAGSLLRKPQGTEDRRACRVASSRFRRWFSLWARKGLSRGGAAR